MHSPALASLDSSVLRGVGLHVVPVLPKCGENAAMMRHVAIPIGGAFPNAHRGEMRRLQRGNVPLIDAVIGNSVEAHFSVGPRLHARPFDRFVKILGLAWREVIDEPGRAAGAA